MDKQAMIEKVKTHTKDGKISCKQAQNVADEEGIPYKDMGTLLNELKIKVANCQLGCFP
jgi:hypothetical protein